MKFPNPEQAGPGGLLALGGDLTPQTLERAYCQGIFPWPDEGKPLLWFCPDPRGVLVFDKLKIPRGVRRAMARNTFEITFNKAFVEVIRACAESPRPGQWGTWILPEMIDAYCELHRLGRAHSVEAWQEGQLVGGTYGVEFQGVFSGESMFYKVSEASKVCLVTLVKSLQARGQTWMDIQMLTPLLEKMGAEEWSRSIFLKELKKAQQRREP